MKGLSYLAAAASGVLLLALILLKNSQFKEFTYQYKTPLNIRKKRSRKFRRNHSKCMRGIIPVVVTEHVDEYREAIDLYVKDTDICLEVGCHNGTTTFKVAEKAKEAIGELLIGSRAVLNTLRN